MTLGNAHGTYGPPIKLWFVLDTESDEAVWFVRAETHFEAVAKVARHDTPSRVRLLMCRGIDFDENGVCEVEMPSDESEPKETRHAQDN